MAGLGAAFPLLSNIDSTGIALLEDGNSNGIQLEDVWKVVKRYDITVTENIGIAPTLGFIRGVLMYELLYVASTQGTNGIWRVTSSDIVKIADSFGLVFDQVLVDTFGVALVQQSQAAAIIIDQLGLRDTLAPAAIFNKSMVDALLIADTFEQFFGAFLGADVVDGIGFTEILLPEAFKGVTVTEGIGVASSLNPMLVLRVTVDDPIVIEDDSALNWLFNTELVDGIRIGSAYIAIGSEHGDQYTTWAMNTRSGAVTEYSNFAFNSFAQFGNVYIGATPTGLYELIGDDDDGTEIVAQIKSGFAQWGGSKFTMFKAAYLGVRGGGEYVLKLTTGDGHTYVYTVNARDMRSTKVRVGKGIRTRYFAFELISTGQDFDLDAIEFVPLITERRI